jgi:DNA-binding XRE family transcriptional regulator
METPLTTLDPRVLGFWTRCIRETSKWSQEALAASSGLDVRTIQRIERGKVAPSLTTRRSLAKGLGYENQDIFDDPTFIKNVHEILNSITQSQREEFKKQHPDHIPVRVAPVAAGEDLLRIAECEAYSLHADDELTQAAKQVAATIFDYVQDLGDGISEVSHSDRVECACLLQQLLEELSVHDAKAYWAKRSTKVVGEHWVNKTPMSLTIGYLTVVPKAKKIQQLMVPRRLS